MHTPSLKRLSTFVVLAAAALFAFASVAAAQDKPECSIEVKGECDELELCGPEGNWEYLWSTGATSRCITVTESGLYELTVIHPDTKEEDKCEVRVEVEPCDVKENCPRTPGYWYQQARQLGNGSTKFSRAQVISIAECVDSMTPWFTWGSGESALSGFLAALNPPRPMTDDRQLRRHLAAFLANICATGVEPTHGGAVSLDPETEVSCNGSTMTLSELLAAINSSSNPAQYKDCLDAINNGIGIPLSRDCGDESKDTGSGALGKGGYLGAVQPGSVQLYRPFPNPFTGATRMAYAVGGAGEIVDIGVYDLSGRRVQTLAKGFMPGGVHEASWDGSNLMGQRVGVGMYFIRGRIGDASVSTRVLFVE